MDNLKAPVFIVGYGHSGTTLLFNVVSKMDGVYSSRGETKFFEVLPSIRRRFPSPLQPQSREELIRTCFESIVNGYNVYPRSGRRHHRLGELGDAQLRELLEVTASANDAAHVFLATFDYLAASVNARFWLEKTPSHIFHLGEILKWRSDARLIEIVRDVRDVLASKKIRTDAAWTTDRYGSLTALKRLEKSYDPILDSLSWRSAVGAGHKTRRAGRQIHSLRYEDLVSDPERTIRRICKFLDVPYADDLLDVPAGNSAVADAPKRRGFATGTISRWREALPPREQAAVQLCAGRALRSHGYPIADVPLAAKLSLPAQLARSGLALVARLYRRAKLGGVRFAMLILGGYFRRLRTVSEDDDRSRLSAAHHSVRP